MLAKLRDVILSQPCLIYCFAETPDETFSMLQPLFHIFKILLLKLSSLLSGTQRSGADSSTSGDATCGASTIGWCGCSGFWRYQSKVWLCARPSLLQWLSPPKMDTPSRPRWTTSRKERTKSPFSLHWWVGGWKGGGIESALQRPAVVFNLMTASYLCGHGPSGCDSWGVAQGSDWARALSCCSSIIGAIMPS